MASSRITKARVQKKIDIYRNEIVKRQQFRERMVQTIKTEDTKISELEGAIIALHELLTGEKVE